MMVMRRLGHVCLLGFVLFGAACVCVWLCGVRVYVRARVCVCVCVMSGFVLRRSCDMCVWVDIDIFDEGMNSMRGQQANLLSLKNSKQGEGHTGIACGAKK